MDSSLCAQRRDQLREKIKQIGLDAFLVTNVLNVSYLTGFTGDDSWLFLDSQRSVLISDPRYELQITEETSGIDSLIRNPGTSLSAAAAGLAASSMKVGVESESMPVAELTRLTDVSNAEWVPVPPLVEQLREIKDETEIAAIRESVRIAGSGFEILRLLLNPEMTEIEARNELECQMRRLGADDAGFPTIAAVGERAALPHAVPTDRFQVKDGEILLVDWGAKKNMYVSDLTRVLVTVKSPSELLRSVYQTVLNAQLAAIAAIRPGLSGAEIDAAARNVIEDAGYGAAFNHGLGHGIGLFVHERGGLSCKSTTLLKPGMVITVEPGIYLPGLFGVRIEDDVLVAEEGAEVLSSGFRKEFDEMVL